MQLTHSYNIPLVTFSVFIAVLASYTALELTERISPKRKIQISWLIGSSVIMGTGIWSMHFIGMLAYNISIPVNYDLFTVVISWFPAIIASGIAFYYLHRGLNGTSLLFAGTLMGSGIGAMHYIGMAAMRVPARMHYDYFVVALSVIFAVILSSIALATANYVKGYLEQEELKLGGSFLMGTAISGLHYIGMAAVNFTITENTPLSSTDLDLKTRSLAYTIGIVTILIIGGAFMACIKAQKQDLQIMSQKLKKSSKILQSVNKELEKRVSVRTAELEKAKEATEQQNIKLKRAKQAVEDAAKSKDVFLANISHELRTPLNSILGYSKILQRDQNLNQSQIRDLKIIQNSGNHLLTLVNDILDLSKSNAAKMELYPRWIEFQAFLDGVIGLIQNSAKEKELLLKLDIQEQLKLVNIKADEKRLRQILINLLNNAVKFTFSGEVILKVTVLDSINNFTQEVTQKTIRFEVIDTGIGMSPEQLKKLFQPFEQFGNAQAKTVGIGLGLSLSRQLVKLMGENLKVKSKLGSGSKFWFDLILPVVEVSKNNASQLNGKQVLGYKGQKRKILIADDKSTNRDLLVKMLEPIGFEIETANDGQETLSVAFSMKPDLILLDLFMPRKTGFTAAKEMRRIPELKHIPIIVISATSITQEMKNFLECEAYLVKPIDEEELLGLLQNYLHLEWIQNEVSLA